MAVLDGIDPGRESVEDAFGSGGVGGDFALELVRFLDDDAHFFDGERGRPPIRINLDEVGAVADLFADGDAPLRGR